MARSRWRGKCRPTTRPANGTQSHPQGLDVIVFITGVFSRFCRFMIPLCLCILFPMHIYHGCIFYIVLRWRYFSFVCSFLSRVDCPYFLNLPPFWDCIIYLFACGFDAFSSFHTGLWLCYLFTFFLTETGHYYIIYPASTNHTSFRIWTCWFSRCTMVYTTLCFRCYIYCRSCMWCYLPTSLV